MTVIVKEAEAVPVISHTPGTEGYHWRFDDLYRIEDRLHSGAFGKVYRVTSKQQPGKEFAVKIIERSNLHAQQERDIMSEVNVMRDVAGMENIVQIKDFFAEENKFYIVQELARGGDVFEKVAKSDLYSEHNARTVALKLLQTIQKLQARGIVHRDIKPENLLLSNPNDKTSILLADFGFATYLPEEGFLMRRCGTPIYSAPEVWKKQPYGKACDMWSIGNILYMLIDGRPPFYSKENKDIFRLVCKGGISFEGPHWDRISCDAKECIVGLLTLDPFKRWTADQALQSPWIQSGRVDALFENLDWVPDCSQTNKLSHTYVYSVVPLNLG